MRSIVINNKRVKKYTTNRTQESEKQNPEFVTPPYAFKSIEEVKIVAEALQLMINMKNHGTFHGMEDQDNTAVAASILKRLRSFI